MRNSLYLVIISTFCFCVPADAQTYVSGNQWGVWDAAGSPYILNGNVTIPKKEPFSDWGADGIPLTFDTGEGDGQYTSGEPYSDWTGNGSYDEQISLTILPGVEICSEYHNQSWQPQGWDILVSGQFTATGVSFSASDTYHSLELITYDGGETNLTDCTFTGSDNYHSYNAGSSGVIDNCDGTWSLDVASDQVAVQNDSEITSITFSGSGSVSGSTIGWITLSGSDIIPIVQNNTFSDTIAIRINDPDASTTGFSNNSFDSSDSYIQISGILNGLKELDNIDGIGSYHLKGNLTVAAEAQLVLLPGVEICSEYHNQSWQPQGWDILVSGQFTATGVSFSASDTYHSLELITYDGGETNLTDCTFTGSDNYHSYNAGSSGVIDNCDGTWSLDVASDQVAVQNDSEITSITFSGSGSVSGSTIGWITLSGSDIIPIVQNNTFSDTIAIRINDPDASTTGFSNNSFDSSDSYIQISGILNGLKELDNIDGIGSYHLKGNLTVAAEAQLVLLPGVEICSEYHNQSWQPQGWDILVSGQFTATGVSFSASDTYHSLELITYEGGETNLTDCTFTGSDNYHSYNAGSSGKLKGCVMGPTKISFFSGIEMSYNNFAFSNVYVYGDPSTTIDLTNNYWGSIIPAMIEARITDQRDDPQRPIVDYIPFLASPWGPVVKETSLVAMPDSRLRQYDRAGDQWIDANLTCPAGELVFVINHGWNDSLEGYMKSIANVIAGQYSGALIVGWDWGDGAYAVSDANPNGKGPEWDFASLLTCLQPNKRICMMTGGTWLPIEVSHTYSNAKLHGALLGEELARLGILPDTYDIHMIGHSFGGVVSAKAAEILRQQSGIPIRQLTTLDTPALIYPYAVSNVSAGLAERVEVIYYNSLTHWWKGAAGGPKRGSYNNLLNLELNPDNATMLLHSDTLAWYLASVSPSATGCNTERYGFGWSYAVNQGGGNWPEDMPTDDYIELSSSEGCIKQQQATFNDVLSHMATVSKNQLDEAYDWFGQQAEVIRQIGLPSSITGFIRLTEPELLSAVATINTLETVAENAPAYIFRTMDIPEYSEQLELELTFDTSNVGDILTVSIYDEIIMVVDASTQTVGEINRYSAYIGQYAGQTVELCIALRGSGDGGAQVDIASLRFARATLAPDIDGSGQVDLADFVVLAQHWQATNCEESETCDNSDLNQDGRVDTIDLAILAEGWMWKLADDLSMPGDFNDDDMTDLTDLTILAAYWLEGPCDVTNDYCGDADIAHDGIIDMFDWSAFVQVWQIENP